MHCTCIAPATVLVYKNVIVYFILHLAVCLVLKIEQEQEINIRAGSHTIQLFTFWCWTQLSPTVIFDCLLCYCCLRFNFCCWDLFHMAPKGTYSPGDGCSRDWSFNKKTAAFGLCPNIYLSHISWGHWLIWWCLITPQDFYLGSRDAAFHSLTLTFPLTSSFLVSSISKRLFVQSLLSY